MIGSYPRLVYFSHKLRTQLNIYLICREILVELLVRRVGGAIWWLYDGLVQGKNTIYYLCTYQKKAIT